MSKDANDANTGPQKKVMADGPRCLLYSTRWRHAHLTRPCVRRQPGFHGGGFGYHHAKTAGFRQSALHVIGSTDARARVRTCMCECVSCRCLRAKMRAGTCGHVRTFIVLCCHWYGDTEATTMEARLSSHGAGQVLCCKEAARPVGHHLFWVTRICITCLLINTTRTNWPRPPRQYPRPPPANFPAPPAN